MCLNLRLRLPSLRVRNLPSAPLSTAGRSAWTGAGPFVWLKFAMVKIPCIPPSSPLSRTLHNHTLLMRFVSDELQALAKHCVLTCFKAQVLLSYLLRELNVRCDFSISTSTATNATAFSGSFRFLQELRSTQLPTATWLSFTRSFCKPC